MHVQRHTSLLPYNTFGIDVEADTLITVESEQDLRQLIADRSLQEGRYLVVGGGSNLVFTQPYRGTVVLMRNKGIRVQSVDGDEVLVEAQAGEEWDAFVRHCVEHDLYGLENLVGIPGSVGAAPVQNVGAYGTEAGDAISLVRAYDLRTGELKVLNQRQCRFGYRDSVFKHEQQGRLIVCSVIFRLSRQFVPNLSYRGLATAVNQRGLRFPTAQQIVDTVASLRSSKLPDPKEIGSAGSFFKNPIVSAEQLSRLRAQYPNIVSFAMEPDGYKLAAGWLIEQCGWKGRSLGNAGVYDKQSLVLVNRGGCTGMEVQRLAKAISDDVEQRFGVRLEPEAIYV